MAISIVNGNRGNFTHKTSSSTWTGLTPSGTLAAGNYALLAVVIDNPGTQEGVTTDITVTDSNSNTWTRLREQTEANTAALTGSSGALFLTGLTEALTTSDTIDIAFNSQNVTAKGAGLAELGVDNHHGLMLSTSGANGANGAAATSYSVALSGLTSVPGLYIGMAVGEEEVDTAVTLDTAYSVLFGGAIGSGTAGLATSNVRALVGTLANTSTGDTFDATGLTSADRATILVRLEEARVKVIQLNDAVQSGVEVEVAGVGTESAQQILSRKATSHTANSWTVNWTAGAAFTATKSHAPHESDPTAVERQFFLGAL